MATRYLIVGNSAGGIGAAEAIRQLDQTGDITIVSEEPYAAYSRPMISKYVAGETTREAMLYRSASFYEEKNITLLAGTPATALDREARTLTLADGRVLPWDKLLLAPGGTPFVPKMEGLDRAGVFTFTTLGDAERLAAHVPGARRAVVIGGGLIGISVAEALVKRHLSVTVVELKDRILNMILDEEGSAIAEAAVAKAGVEILTNRTVASVVGRPQDGGAVVSVFLDNGREVPCDLLLVAIGVVPRVELARAAGLTVNRGIAVDDHMQTSAANVYACGDAVEAYDFALDTIRPTPIWPNAYIGGRVAGRNMAGTDTRSVGGTACNSLNYFGLSLVSAGMMSPNGDEGFSVLRRAEPERGVYRKVILKNGKLVGMVYVGPVDRSGIAFGLMREGADVSGYAEQLLGDDFGLISLPREQRTVRMEGKLNGAYA